MIQLCALQDIPILAIASSEEKCAFAKAQGATATVNSSSEDLAQAISEFTGGRGLDLMFDHVVGPGFREKLKFMGPLGQIISFNALGGLPSSDLFADLRKNLDRSVSVRAFSVHVYDAYPEERRRIAREVGALYADGRIHPRINQRFPLGEATASHRALEDGHALGKIVLKP
jgi:NADPH2:quinone reductase